MTNPTPDEIKAKEIFDVGNWIVIKPDDFDGYSPQEVRNAILEGIKLGEKKAQKEFLKFLTSLSNDYHGGDRIGNGCEICIKMMELSNEEGEKWK